ncbi:unnamed protein product [Protopolystoma xenopodis]|uniref:Uncharacterized protein n=1 Tax=Protopolystoma xenopodis TaxID=117903 RepID=A0A448WK64_9PLAT|nr:unnamed protein product [Protopolystoma xenopodis]
MLVSCWPLPVALAEERLTGMGSASVKDNLTTNWVEENLDFDLLIRLYLSRLFRLIRQKRSPLRAWISRICTCGRQPLTGCPSLAHLPRTRGWPEAGNQLWGSRCRRGT